MAKSKKKAEAFDWQVELSAFFSSALAIEAARPLSERAKVAVYVDGRPCLFQRRSSTNTAQFPVGEVEADLHFWLSEYATRQLLNLAKQKDTSLSTMGIAVFQNLLRAQGPDKIKFRVDASFLALWSKGYFSVLKAGGPEVASYLAKKGFGSLSKMKDILQRIQARK